MQHFQADLRVNFEFGRGIASEVNRTSILIKLNELAVLCVRSGEVMVFPTIILASYNTWPNPNIHATKGKIVINQLCSAV